MTWAEFRFELGAVTITIEVVGPLLEGLRSAFPSKVEEVFGLPQQSLSRPQVRRWSATLSKGFERVADHLNEWLDHSFTLSSVRIFGIAWNLILFRFGSSVVKKLQFIAYIL